MKKTRSSRPARFVICHLDDGQVSVSKADWTGPRHIKVPGVDFCVASHRLIAAIIDFRDVQVLGYDGLVVFQQESFVEVRTLVFHPTFPGVLVVGLANGYIKLFDLEKQCEVALLTHHSRCITSTEITADGRLFVSSYDKTASIITLDREFQVASSVHLLGHTDYVNSILPLPLWNICVTSSTDTTLKVWDCQSGECIRSLPQHIGPVVVLTSNTNGQIFAGSARCQPVIIWSSETFEVLQRISFPCSIESLAFDEDGVLYVGVKDCGVMPCNALSGQVGPVAIPASGWITSISIGTVHACILWLFPSH
jgi:WD40 repeat protein